MNDRTSAAGRILLVDDDVSLSAVLGQELERLGFRVAAASDGASALAQCARDDHDVILLDLKLGREHGLDVLDAIRRQGVRSEVIVITGHGTIESAVEAMRRGAREYLTKPCALDELEVHLRKAIESRRVQDENRELKSFLSSPDADRPIITVSEQMNALLTSVERVAASDVHVLIQGESGTGKELIARRIHQSSPIRSEPFLAVNCAVLKAGILESELFGHEKGAFTGAVNRKLGLFEIASGGTLFLDEIGDIDESVQAKLLRVLQSGELRRLGGTENLFVRTRVIAASNKRLEREVEEGRFRQDLLFRLNVVTLTTVPLRERPDDIGLLFAHYLRVFGSGSERKLTTDAEDLLRRYAWPGNVRELENVVRRVLIFHDQTVIDAGVIRAVLPRSETNENVGMLTLAEIERRHILRVLAEQNGDKRAAAEILQVSLKTLYNKLHAYGAM